jgi:hypothetical protein
MQMAPRREPEQPRSTPIAPKDEVEVERPQRIENESIRNFGQPQVIAPEEKEDDTNDDDDWGAVPAFLRRKKL